MKRSYLSVTLILLLFAFTGVSQEWVSLFDGQTMNGWQPSENKDTWRVEDGALVCHGARSHLFYMGDVSHHDFKNFEVRAEVKTRPGSNSGLYVHTHYEESGFPSTGYECQVINSNTNNQPGKYVERKMTSSIYAIRNVWKAPAKDDEWFHYRVVVQGKTLRTYINDELMAEYTEPESAFRPEDKKGRLLSSGTFALQGHDPGSVVAFRKIEVKMLSDDLPTPGKPTDDPTFDAQIIQLGNSNFPLLDLDVQISDGLSMDDALANSRKYGYTYGFVFDGSLPAHFRQPPQAFAGLRVAVTNVDALPSTHEHFDYVIANLTMQTNMIADPQQFMDQLVGEIGKLARSGRANIYGRATALPHSLQKDYATLWSPERMDQVIQALKDGHVAMEINDRLHVPSAAFIKRAKAAGVSFTFGSDNTGATDLGRLDYCIAMIKECSLKSSDVWLP